ncbi:MAG TPA: DMT family transporter [Azospirillum sp.]
MTEQAAVARSAPGTAVYAQIAGVVVFWGSNWLLMKIALADMGPLTFSFLRYLGAALLLAALLAWKLRMPLLPVMGDRWGLAFIGLLQVALMPAMSAAGLQFLPPGRAAVLVYTMQIWALPLGWLIAGERVSGQRTLGALLAFAGVLVFFNPTLVDWSDPNQLIGNGLLLTSAALWALAASLYRRRAWRTPFWTQTLWQIGVSAVAIGPVALVFEADRAINPTLSLGLVLVYNWVVATALCYAWWSKALTAMPAAQVGQIVCLVPFTALGLSALLMGEPLTLSVLAAVALIGAGILITVRAPR